MFTPIGKKYCKEPSLRYCKEPPIGKFGLHKPVGKESFSFTPIEKKTGGLKNGFHRNTDFRFHKEQPATKQFRESTEVSGLFDNGLSTLQEEPLVGGYTRCWTENKVLGQIGLQEQCVEDQGLKCFNEVPGLKNSYSRTAGRKYADPCNDRPVRDQGKTYGNQLLALRAELSEKELQLVEIQQQHNKLICRSTDAFKRLEVAIRTKDQVIWQLHQALQSKQDELERQEKLFEEGKHVLLQKEREQRNSEVEQKEKEIALLRAKNVSQNQELQQHEELISSLKQQLQDKEKSASSPTPQYMFNKMDALIGQVQSLESSLQNKESEVETHRQLCNELKTLVWKRECMIAQLQLAEQQLQSALVRQTEAYSALEVLKDKLQDDKSQTEKNMAELKEELQALGTSALDDRHLKEDLQIHEGCLQNQRRQIHELQRALHAKDVALTSQSKKFQQQHEENQKLIEDYELLRQEYAALKLEKDQLESNLANLEEQLVASKIRHEINKLPDYGFAQDTAFNEDQEILEVFGSKNIEYEQDMQGSPNPVTPTRVGKGDEPRQLNSPDTSLKNSGCESELVSIEEEIGRREKEWRQTEAKMRAELCRRLAQLSELENFRPEMKQDLPARPESFRSHTHVQKKHQSPF